MIPDYFAVDPDVYCRECGSREFTEDNCCHCEAPNAEGEMEELLAAGAVRENK